MNKTFEEWFKKNYEEEYIEDGDWQNFTLSDKEIAGSAPDQAHVFEVRETIKNVSKIVWDHKEQEIKDLKEKVEKMKDALEDIAEYPVIPDLKHVINTANKTLKEPSNE